MKRLVYIWIFLFLLPFSIKAGDTYLKEAIRCFENGNINKGIQMIDSSFATAKAITPEHWYYKASLYIKKTDYHYVVGASKAIYELENTDLYNKRKSKIQSIEADIISTSYQQSEHHLKLNKKLATDFFQIFYDHTRQLNWSDSQVQTALTVASVLSNNCIKNIDTTNFCFTGSKNIYHKILDQDPENWGANFYLGNLYYNQAIIKIKSLDYDTDIFVVDQVQNESIKLFFNSVPYLQKAYQINPNEKIVVKSLSEVYHSLNDENKSKEYQKLLEN